MFVRTARTGYALLLLPLLACGSDDDVGTDPDPEVPVPTSLHITPGSDTLTAIGDAVRLEAEVRDQDGEVMAGATVTWSSLEEGVATVSGTGLVTAAAEGEARIVATAGEAADTAVITVAQVPVAVGVAPDSVHLRALGDSVQLSAVVRDANGHEIEGEPVACSSADTTVAAVSVSGWVVARDNGTTVVEARAGQITGTAIITVQQVPASLDVSPDSVTFSALGDSIQLSAVVRDADGNELEGAALTWSSADTAIASVSSAGWVVAQGNGTASVQASYGGLADEAMALVEQVAAAVQVSPAEATLAQGDTVRLTAAVTDSNGVVIEGAAVTWSSADEDVATVDGSGLVTAARGGETQIEATVGGAAGAATLAVLDRLLFQSFSFSDNDTEIYAMNADGSDPTRLTNAAGEDFGPAWSPDGMKIAFYSSRDGNYEIYVMNADGTGQTNLTNSAAYDESPAWQPRP